MVALSDQDFVDLFVAQGVTPTVASLIKAHVNDDMARCILALYRSAAQPALAAVGKLFTTAAPPNGLTFTRPVADTHCLRSKGHGRAITLNFENPFLTMGD